MRKSLQAICITILLLVSIPGKAQTTTTYTGQIRDLSGANVTQGQITFQLMPGSDTTISGLARFTGGVPVTCTITGAGLVKALDGSSACTVTNNTSLTPSGTYYQACIQPQFIVPGSCFNLYALGGTIDLSTVVPTPSTVPAYSFVDLFSNQTISGNKTFSGTSIFNGNTTINGSLTYGTLNGTAWNIKALGTATSGANFNSGTANWCGSYWTGVAAASDCWTWKNVVGSGTNPSVAYTLTHSGSSGPASISINSNVNLNGGQITGASKDNGFYYVDGTTYSGPQAAISAACAAGGGTVYFVGVYAQNQPFTLCSNLNLIGAGSCQVDVVNCPSMITTTMTSGDLFPVTNMTDINLQDFGVKGTGAGPANAILRLNYGQRVRAQRLYFYGSSTAFIVGIELDSSSTSTGSTIWNEFRDIHITGLAPNGIGCELNSHDATNKVINNNYFFNVACQGGASGASAAGVWITNSNNLQNINENVFFSGEIATTSAVGGGTGFLLTSTATRGVACIECNIENNVTGFSKANGNTVIFVGGNISSNTTNVSDSQPAFTSFLNTNVGGTVQQFSITPAGDVEADGFGINATPLSGGINGASGWCLGTVGGCRYDVFTGSFSPHTAAGSSLGIATQPFSDIFIGGAANKALDFNTAALSANRQVTWSDNAGTVPLTIASGTTTLGNANIGATTCNAAVTTGAAGALTTDKILWAYASAPSGTTDGKLILSPYLTAGNVNFVLCNPTAGGLVPTGLVVNWSVVR